MLARKRYPPEKVISMLRESERERSQGFQIELVYGYAYEACSLLIL